jgi:hemolysin III
MQPGERLNTLTHLIGALLALGASIALVTRAVQSGDALKIVSFAVFGAALVFLYTSSTLYHGARGPAKLWLRKLDHCAIYVLIAGTYAPFALVTLKGWLGFSLLTLVCVLSVLGIALELRHRSGSRAKSVALYIAMGWLGVVAAAPLFNALGADGFAWLAVGGALYTGGVIFYALDERLRHAHGVWHLFVLGGSAAHFSVVLRFV